MANSAQPSLFLLAGPNGAGKSTLYMDRIKPITLAPFVNADEIAQQWQRQGLDSNAYAAAKEAAAQRQQLIEQRRSFVTETVFSHPSKLGLIETALAGDYRDVLYHVNVRHPDMAVARVGARVATGGHCVPEGKIVERYERHQPLIRQAAELASVTLVFDNSKVGRPPRWLLTFQNGRVVQETEADMPSWAARLYLEAD